jgi:hypothetical protein
MNKTDILVLTETRAKTMEEGENTYIKKSRLKVTMTTTSGRPAAGVTVLTNNDFLFLEESSRESEPAGHYVIGAYKTKGRCFIIGGIYLDSSGNDQTGVMAVQMLSAHITELKQMYGTNCVMIAGDFNVTLYAEQSHSGRMNKPRTFQELQDLLAEHGMQDVGRTHRMEDPTYR